MRKGGFNLGGEQSGHIVMNDFSTTGDGLLAGLQFLATLVETNKRASEIAKVFTACPQEIKNIKYTVGSAPLEDAKVKKILKESNSILDGKGRILIRESGTEPLIRVMVEAEDEALLSQVIHDVVQAVQNVA